MGLVKDANVQYPKTKCDLCEQTAVAVVDNKAVCKDCRQELEKRAAFFEKVDVYEIPTDS